LHDNTSFLSVGILPHSSMVSFYLVPLFYTLPAAGSFSGKPKKAERQTDMYPEFWTHKKLN
jgi:hypothetical protein